MKVRYEQVDKVSFEAQLATKREVATIRESLNLKLDSDTLNRTLILEKLGTLPEVQSNILIGTSNQNQSGLQSSADKIKLDNIAPNASKVEVSSKNGNIIINDNEMVIYTHPATHPASVIVENDTKRFVTDDQINSWTAKASTAIATTTANGLLSKDDKLKLDGISVGSKRIEDSSVNGNILIDNIETVVYAHPATHAASEIVESITKRFVTDTQIASWTAKASTATVTTTVNGLMVSTDKVKLDGISVNANKTEASATNGNIKINGVETKVFIHPATHTASEIVESNTKRFVTDTQIASWTAKAETTLASGTTNGLMVKEDKSKLDSITASATKTQKSTTNGNLLINGTETVVYTHPANHDDRYNTKEELIDPAGASLIGVAPITGLTGSTIQELLADLKQYSDALVQQLDIKHSVRVATTINITLSGLQTIDGVALADNDRVLVKNQTDGKQNGIYDAKTGAWTRSEDADNKPTPGSEVTSGMFTFVSEGLTQDNTGWVLTTNDKDINLDVSTLNFVQFSGAGMITAGTGLSKSGNVMSVAPTGITPGAYTKVTVNAQGQVTTAAGLIATDIPKLDWSHINTGKPTTLAGFGITDAAPLSHVGVGGNSHSLATTTDNGFMAAADKLKLNGIPANADANQNSFSVIMSPNQPNIVADSKEDPFNIKGEGVDIVLNPTDSSVTVKLNVHKGISVFNGLTGVVIPHTFGVIPSVVMITPKGPSEGKVGEYYYTATESTITVYNTGSGLSEFAYIAFK